jgi:hypothetical protein
VSIKTVAVVRFIWSVNSISIKLTRGQIRKIAVPHLIGLLSEWNSTSFLQI